MVQLFDLDLRLPYEPPLGSWLVAASSALRDFPARDGTEQTS